MARERQLPGRELVYRHCLGIFSEERALIRKLSPIESLLQANKDLIAMLTKDFTIPDIAQVAQGLLKDHVFEREACARAFFPDLFRVSKAQVADPATSEVEAIGVTTKTVANTIISTLHKHRASAKRESAPSPPNRRVTRSRKNEISTLEGPRDNSLDDTCIQPSEPQVGYAEFPLKSDPVYLPFKTQHRIVVAIQRLLEECCLEWGNAYVPELMKAHDWNEVESIELTEWTKIVLAQAKILPAAAMKRPSQQETMNNLLSVSRIRHSAVHRIRLNATELLSMISAAVDFAKALESHSQAQKIVSLRAGLKTSLANITEHRKLLEPQFSTRMELIALKRAALIAQENSIIKDAIDMDRNQRAEAGSHLEGWLTAWQQHPVPQASNRKRSWDEANEEFTGDRIDVHSRASYMGDLSSYIGEKAGMALYNPDHLERQKRVEDFTSRHSSTPQNDAEVTNRGSREAVQSIVRTSSNLDALLQKSCEEDFAKEACSADSTEHANGSERPSHAADAPPLSSDESLRRQNMLEDKPRAVDMQCPPVMLKNPLHSITSTSNATTDDGPKIDVEMPFMSSITLTPNTKNLVTAPPKGNAVHPTSSAGFPQGIGASELKLPPRPPPTYCHYRESRCSSSDSE